MKPIYPLITLLGYVTGAAAQRLALCVNPTEEIGMLALHMACSPGAMDWSSSGPAADAAKEQVVYRTRVINDKTLNERLRFKVEQNGVYWFDDKFIFKVPVVLISTTNVHFLSEKKGASKM